jgi:hypothetical protein
MKAGLAVAAVGVGCASVPQVVSLTRGDGATANGAASEASPLEVVTVGTAVRDPLPVRGSEVAYADLEAALGATISAATSPWAVAHHADATAARGGWTVLVEIAKADAELQSGGRVVVGMDARATLRARRGNVYLGQTQVGCREGGLVDANGGSPVIQRCIVDMARELAGWLAGGVPLDPPEDPTHSG